jgi:hypothetical protein
MPALIIISLTLLLFAGDVFAFSSKKPEVIPMPDFNREIPVQLFLGRQTEIMFDDRGVIECFRKGVQLFLGRQTEIMFDDRGVIECFRKGELSEIYYMTSNLHLKADGGGITIHDENGEITSGLSGIRCKPRGSSSYVNFDGKSYRGYFKVAYDSLSSYLILYNLVDLEDYLKGVLPAEIGERSKDEYEAAKAQAVAARTYAVWRLISDGEAGKLYPTVADQVYIGKDAELDLLSRAIKDTEGEILMYKGGPVAAYYHAVCGGATIPIEKA